MDFVKSLSAEKNVSDEWKAFINQKKKEEFDKIIQEENLKQQETYKFIEEAIKIGEIRESGTSIVDIMPRVSMFGNQGNARADKKSSIIEKLLNFFNRFFGL